MAKAVALTEAAIKRFPAAPVGNRVDRPDRLAPGLFLRINDKGRKSWLVHFRVKGRQGKLALGSWPAMKVDEAREIARWAREQAKSGIHPRIVREQEEAEKRRSAGKRFDAVAETYTDAAKTGKLLGARKQPVTMETALGRESRIHRLILPVLGARPIKDISPVEVSEFLSGIEADGGPVDRCLQDIRLIYKFAISRGLFHGPLPTDGLGNRQAPSKKSRALEDHELRAMWVAAGEYGYPFGQAIRLLMLTGQRRDEIGDARWSDLDMERRLLTIPSSRSKNRKGDHEVPLSDSAMAIIEDTRRVCEALSMKSDYLFTNTGNTSISGWSKASKRLDRYMRAELAALSPQEREALVMKGKLNANNKKQKSAAAAKVEAIELKHWRFHDLRHTVVTRMRNGEENRDGETTFAVPLDVVQQIVNHELTAGVTAVYDHGDIEKRYRLRKREALEWWGRKLMGIVGEAPVAKNVVALSTGK
jgi:integrase